MPKPIDPKEFVPSEEEMKELEEAQQAFIDKMIQISFRNVHKGIEAGYAVSTESLLVMIDRDLCAFVSPKIVDGVTALIKEDQELCKQNEAAFQKEIERLRAAMVEQMEHMAQENPDLEQNPLFNAMKGHDPTELN